MTAWMPIPQDVDVTKAPFDGKHVLVGHDGWTSEARYLAVDGGWWLAQTYPTDHEDGRVYPTHWQPLPAPPSP